jgi:hypothetical protein
MTYLPRHVRQHDGSSHQGTNCLMATGATLLDRQTLGLIQTTGADMRQRSRRTQPGAYSNFGDLSRAFASFSETLIYTNEGSWDGLLRRLGEGRGVVVLGNYGQLTPGNKCSPYTGDHAWYLQADKIGDPLCSAYRAGYLGEIRKAAEHLGRRAAPDRTPTVVQYAYSHVPLPDTSTGGDMARVRITDPAPKRISVRPGAQLFDPAGVAQVTVSNVQGAASPFACEVNGTRYRALHATTGGVPFLFLVRPTDITRTDPEPEPVKDCTADVAAAIEADRLRARVTWD